MASVLVTRGVVLMLAPLLIVLVGVAPQVDWYGVWARCRDRCADGERGR